MNNILKLTMLITSLSLVLILETYTVSYFLMVALVMIYCFKQFSLMNLMILLELMVLNLFFLYFYFASGSAHEAWNIFFILVFSAAEASMGLALLVYLSRAWGEMLKISKFNWLCSLMKP